MNMSMTTAYLDKKQSHSKMPGEAGIWLFIFGDLMVFSLFFGTFLFYRAEDVPLYIESQGKLNETFGVLNTALMLSSSWFVALAVNAARKGMKNTPTILFMLGFLCGAGFGVVKFFEYGEKISHGITLNTNDFFMYYYLFTGIHFLHVMIGMGVLMFMALYCRARAGEFADKDIRNVESGACFWHVVDLLWIVLFALLYMVK